MTLGLRSLIKMEAFLSIFHEIYVIRYISHKICDICLLCRNNSLPNFEQPQNLKSIILYFLYIAKIALVLNYKQRQKLPWQKY